MQMSLGGARFKKICMSQEFERPDYSKRTRLNGGRLAYPLQDTMIRNSSKDNISENVIPHTSYIHLSRPSGSNFVNTSTLRTSALSLNVEGLESQIDTPINEASTPDSEAPLSNLRQLHQILKYRHLFLVLIFLY